MAETPDKTSCARCGKQIPKKAFTYKGASKVLIVPAGPSEGSTVNYFCGSAVKNACYRAGLHLNEVREELRRQLAT